MKRRRKHEKIIAIQTLLEKRNKFNTDYGVKKPEWTMPGADFPYRKKGVHKAIENVERALMQLIAPAVLKIKYGIKIVGRENLKELKNTGAIAVCNHCYFLDVLFTRQALGYFRTYTTIAPFNNTNGLSGALLRHGGVLPFSANLKAMKNMNAEAERLINKGKFICFYPEQALWDGYQKPRPMKAGAFFYAAKFGAPVVPVFCTFKRTKRCGIRQVRVHILKPIYPDGSLSKKAQVADMQKRAESAWYGCYEKAYLSCGEAIPNPSPSEAFVLAEGSNN